MPKRLTKSAKKPDKSLPLFLILANNDSAWGASRIVNYDGIDEAIAELRENDNHEPFYIFKTPENRNMGRIIDDFQECPHNQAISGLDNLMTAVHILQARQYKLIQVIHIT